MGFCNSRLQFIKDADVILEYNSANIRTNIRENRDYTSGKNIEESVRGERIMILPHAKAWGIKA